jgi:hypothetical protein
MAFDPENLVPIDEHGREISAPQLADLVPIDKDGNVIVPPKPENLVPYEPGGIIRRAVGDTGVSLAKGVVDAGQTLYGLADAASGGTIDRASDAITRAASSAANTVGDFLTGNHVGQDFGPVDGERLSQGFQRANDKLSELYSPQTQEALQKVNDAKGFVDTTKAALENPSSIYNAAVESAPTMAGMLGVVRGGAALAARTAFSKAVEAGATRAAAEEAAAKAATRWSTGAPGIGVQAATDAATSGAQQSQQAKTDVLEMDSKDLAKSPLYQKLIEQGVTPKEARAQLADMAQTRSFLVSGALSAAASPLASGVEGKAATAGMARAATRKFLGIPEAGAVKTLAKDVGAEFAQEGLQSAGEQFGTNVGEQVANPDIDLSSGVGNQAALGALTGGLMGGGMSVIHQAAGHGEHGAQEQPGTASGASGAPLGLPAPKDVAPNLPGSYEPSGAQLETRLAVDSAASAREAARAAEEERLRQFASNGPISAAATVAIRTGASADAHARATDEIASADAGSSLPIPIDAADARGIAGFAQFLPSTSLQQAQQAAQFASTAGHDFTVVPHPSGGFTMVPSAVVPPAAADRLASLQRGGMLPSPDMERPGAWIAPEGRTPQAATYDEAGNRIGLRNAIGEFRRDVDQVVPRGTEPAQRAQTLAVRPGVPLKTVAAAQKVAARLTIQSGTEFEVVPHPFAYGKYGVRPVPPAIDAGAPNGSGGMNQRSGLRAVQGNAESQEAIPVGLQQLVSHAPTLQQSPASRLEVLRRNGSRNSSTMEDELREFSRGYGSEAGAGTVDRSDRPSRQLPSSQLPLGNSATAGSESPSLQQARGEGSSNDDRRSGEVPRGAADDISTSNPARAFRNGGIGAGAFGSGSPDADVPGPYPNGRSLGDESGRTEANPQRAAAARNSSRAGAVTRSAPFGSTTKRLTSRIRELGGIDLREASDTIGERGIRATRMQPGLFRPTRMAAGGRVTQGHALSTLVHDGQLDAYLPPELRSDTGREHEAVEHLRELISRDLVSKDVTTHDDREERAIERLREDMARDVGGRRMTPNEERAWLGEEEKASDDAIASRDRSLEEPVTTARQAPSARVALSPIADRVAERLTRTPARAITDLTEGRQLSSHQARPVADAVRHLIASRGMPPSMFEGMTPIHAQPAGGHGTYYWRESSIGVRRDVLDAAANGDRMWRETLPGLIAHETFHHLDNAPSDYFSSAAPSFEIKVNSDGRRVPTGGIIKEAWNAYLTGPRELQQFLAYPFAKINRAGDETLTFDQWTNVLKNETFAQLGRLYYTNPALLARTMPLASDLFEEIHRGAERSTSIDAARGAVRESLRARDASGRVADDADRETGRNAGGGAREQQAGAGLGGSAGVRHPAAQVAEREPVFYSALARAIDEKAPFAKDGLINVGQLRMWLSARVKDGTIKGAEVQAVGLDDWLATQTGKVSRASVKTFLEQNGVRVEETMLSSNHAYSYVGNEWQQAIDRAEADGDFEEAERIQRAWDGIDEETGSIAGQPKFADYQLPGGTNYRELLLTLPPAQREPVSPYEAWRARQGFPDEQWVRDMHAEQRGKADAPEFRSSHFDQPNILAHVRFNDRTDAHGRRVLFAEELQSDWAQKGRRGGFAGPAPMPAAKLPDDWSFKADGNNVKLYHDGEWKATGTIQQWNDAAAIEKKAVQIYNSLAASDANPTDAVPAGPFVGKTEAWVALVLKRMIRYAAEHGYDRVAWTNGAQQAERYDLSKAVRSIMVTPRTDAVTGEKTRAVTLDVVNSGDVTLGVDAKGVIDAARGMPDAEGKNLSEVIGKDLADKVMQTERGTFSGNDLKVGGDGMRSFYDKIVPNVANDVLKKLGGGRVTTMDLGARSRLIHGETEIPDGRPVEVIEGRNGLYTLRMEGSDITWGMWEHTPYGLDRAKNALTKFQAAYREQKVEQMGFDIPDSMRERAMRPQALFLEEPTIAGRATAQLADLFQSTKAFNLWDKTVGTQYHKAQKNPHFRKVFEGAQKFLNDASRMANEAADLAPDLLPKLERLRDLIRGGPTKKDIATVSRAVFDGTLADRVWSDDEVRRRGLTPRQSDLYRQARATIDRSLDQLLLSEAIKEASGVAPAQAIERARTSGDAGVITSALADLADPTVAQKQVAAQLREKAERIADLKENGYAPLMRFGKYAVHVTDASGGSVLFTLHESEREANSAARAVRQSLEPGQNLTQSILSEDAWQLFEGVSPDTLEIFGDALGASESDLFQQYLKLATNNRSTLKRLIQRKEIPGYVSDIQRVLAQFVTSNSRAAAKNLHWGEVLRATNEIPKEAGDVKDEAIRLARYIERPGKEAGAVRGLLFVQFLGGSVASALTNATQPILMSFPYLAKYGTAKAASELIRAGRVAAGTLPREADLRDALGRATKEGIIAPHEVAGLYAESIRNFGSNLRVRKALRVWGSMFSLAEAFNRRITFVAAYRLAREAGEANPYEAAASAVAETQGVYNRGNRPNWARGAVGGTLFTFKQYSIAYLEFLKRLPTKQRMLALAVLVMAAGLQGLPGAEDAEDIVDTIAQSLGLSFNSRRALRQWAVRTLGESAGGLLFGGASNLPGVPLDVQARLGVGNLIPGTGLLKISDQDKGADVAEFFGPVGSQAQAFLNAAGAAQMGQYGAVAMSALPLAVQNALRAMDMASTGYYRDIRGRRVIDVSAADAAIKALGFQPSRVSGVQQVTRELQQDIALNRAMTASIADEIAQGVAEHDPAKVQRGRARQLAWNLANPGSPISILPRMIQDRVRAMLATKDERFAKAAPAHMRAGIRAELEPVQ